GLRGSLGELTAWSGCRVVDHYWLDRCWLGYPDHTEATAGLVFQQFGAGGQEPDRGSGRPVPLTFQLDRGPPEGPGGQVPPEAAPAPGNARNTGPEDRHASPFRGQPHPRPGGDVRDSGIPAREVGWWPPADNVAVGRTWCPEREWGYHPA